MKIDFNKLKTDISLPDFLSSLGWKFVNGSSNTSPKMSNGDRVIVIKKNPAGQYTYWDVHTSDVYGKSIIDIMQEHIFNTTGKMPSLREAAEAIMRFVTTNEIVHPLESRFDVGNTALTQDQIVMLIHQLKPYHGDYLQKRGISKEVLLSPVFADTFYTRSFKKNNSVYKNLCVKMINEVTLKAISQRNEEYKGILGEKFDSLAFSHHDASRPIDVLYVGESMIDNISHYQLRNLHNTDNILYASTEGTLTMGQMALIQKVINRHQIKKVICIFDNDENGYKYTIWLYNYLHNEKISTEKLTVDELKAIIHELPFEIELSSPEKDWNDRLTASLKTD